MSTRRFAAWQRSSRAPSPEEVFAAVTEETGVLLGAQRATLLRVVSPEWAEFVASWSDGTAPLVPVGHRGVLDGRGIVGKMLHTARPIRIEDFDEVGEAVAALMRELGIRSGAGGAQSIPGRRTTADPVVESELRLYGAFYAAYGVAMLNTARRADVPSRDLHALAAVLFAAGLARAGARRTVGRPSRQQIVLLALELGAPPSDRSLASRRPTGLGAHAMRRWRLPHA